MNSFAPVLTLALALPTIVSAQDWPQWRGSNRDGLGPEVEIDRRHWPKSLTRRWKIPVGEGHATPLVVGDAAFVFSRRGEDEVLAKLDLANGKTVWLEQYPAPYKLNSSARSHGKGPKSTPVHANRRIFTLGISGVLSGVDAGSGKLLWRKHFDKKYATTSPLYGTSMSPIVERELVIAHVGGHDDGALTAFDAATGDVRWTWKDDGPSYASPIICELEETRQLVTQTQRHVVGIAPLTGKLLWKIAFKTPYDQNSVTPIQAGDVVVYSGTKQGIFGLELDRTAGDLKAKERWSTKDASMYMSSPILVGDHVFGMSERKRGTIFCMDPRSGKVLWQSAGRMGENVALVGGSREMWLLTTGGELIVIEPSRTEYKERARYKVAESPTWAHPVVLWDRVLIKDKTTLASWSLTASK